MWWFRSEKYFYSRKYFGAGPRAAVCRLIHFPCTVYENGSGTEESEEGSEDEDEEDDEEEQDDEGNEEENSSHFDEMLYGMV